MSGTLTLDKEVSPGAPCPCRAYLHTSWVRSGIRAEGEDSGLPHRPPPCPGKPYGLGAWPSTAPDMRRYGLQKRCSSLASGWPYRDSLARARAASVNFPISCPADLAAGRGSRARGVMKVYRLDFSSMGSKTRGAKAYRNYMTLRMFLGQPPIGPEWHELCTSYRLKWQTNSHTGGSPWNASETWPAR